MKYYFFNTFGLFQTFSKMRYLIFLFLLVLQFAISQQIPPIQNYSTDLYKAGNQNWKITQDSFKNIYVANNSGLLQFDGQHWDLYPTPNETILRSVHVNNKVIYSGAYMDFGFWLTQLDGSLEYTSLVDSLMFDMIEDEQIWSILEFEQFIIFQSLNRLIIFDPIQKTLKSFFPQEAILKAFVNKNGIFFQDTDLSIYKIVNGLNQLYISSSKLKEVNVIALFDTPYGELVVTHNNGIFNFVNDQLYPWFSSTRVDFQNEIVYTASQSKEGDIIVGTVKNGAYYIDAQGELINHFNIDNGLQNNTVLSSFFDTHNNLWFGLDNGIVHVNLNTSLNYIPNVKKKYGTVYTSLLFEDYLYIGTNQGLFYKKFKSNDDFIPIKGLEGQVWSLQNIQGQLFCGHGTGAYLIQKNKSVPLYENLGFWLFKEFNDTTILAGSYNGLHVITKNKLVWEYAHSIKGSDISTRFFELIEPHEIIVSHEYKGLFRFSLSSDLKQVDNKEQINDFNKSLFSSISASHGEVFYFSKEGFYKYDVKRKQFIKNDEVSALFSTSNFVSGKMVEENDKLWIFAKNNLFCLDKNPISGKYWPTKYPLSSNVRKIIRGFENISPLQDTSYLIGTSEGYLIFDTSKQMVVKENLYLKKFLAQNINNKSISYPLKHEIDIPSNFNTISFTFNTPYFDYNNKPEFQYRLLGYSNNWSQWSQDTSITYGNLNFGDYEFEVKARVGDVPFDNQIRHAFSIDRAWYISDLMLVLYLFALLFISFLVNSYYSKYYLKRQNQIIQKNKKEMEMVELKSREEIMRLKNSRLQENIETKNKELAISTMTMIKKNQFLNSIIVDLDPVSKEPVVSRVIRTIKRTLKNDDDWSFFEEAFNNADKDFLKRMKNVHPSLTHNDLKLCAYLRLNLSSKEIAPLLNISVRSVEIKRYRLRKKMELEHSQSLIDYIITL